MRTTTRLLGAIVLGVSCALSAGCLAVAAAGAATAGVLYVRGELRSTVDADTAAVVKAAEATLDDMGFNVVSAKSSSVDGEVTARTAQDTRILINVKAESDSVTRYTIRVGTFGDESLSRQIDEKIRARL